MEIVRAIAPSLLSGNTQPPITRIISEIDLRIQKFTTYKELMKQYDPQLLQNVDSLGIAEERIIVVEVQMMPEDMHWMIWKNFSEINQFLMKIKPDIQSMKKIQQFQLDKNGANVKFQIQSEHTVLISQCSRGIIGFNQAIATRFIQFLNKIGQQLYLRKTILFLTFISHCISIDKWPVMIHYQTYLYKNSTCSTNKLMGYFKSSNDSTVKQVQSFVTITNDGILISDDHLLLSKVNKMIPFTNQMKIKSSLTSDQNLVYQISSGRIQALTFNFYKDYAAAVSFGCGLGRALRYAGYLFVMGTNSTSLQNDNLGFIKSQLRKSNYTQNRFKSFAQQRQQSNCKLYSDGCGYYQDLYSELMKAQKQVCITGWMITPYFLLKRPGNINDPTYRLDGVLQKLGSRGVKIFIIVFMQPSMFVNNDSQHVQTHLQGLHQNIKVYRHPNVAVPQLWSHHQKLIVIDQKIGFMGGLDICYGRWDTHEHRLVESETNPGKKFWDGQQFNNYRLKDIYTPRQFGTSNLNQDFQPRMPWHDIAVQIRGDVVIDLLRHFVQYWYFVKSQLSTDPRVYYNTFMNRISKANSYYENVQKKYVLAQMKQMKQATVQTFAQKWNGFKQKMGVVVLGTENRISELLIEQRTGMNAGNLSIQMLRSASSWSIGLDQGVIQSSIHNAYQELIQNSQSHIYIQNQFFMGLQNKIVQVLANRIIKAKFQNKKFRVVIVMPLLPGFQGYIGDPGATVLRIQMHWQYQAISRNKATSLHSRLSAQGFSRQQIDNYIYFFGLRKGQLLNNIPITQIIYVHSKLMMVDDKRMIVGSANINDRSLLGSRDSQIAICIQDKSGTYLNSFRAKIYEEHFGLAKNSCVDTLNDNVWNDIKNGAKMNTNIFRSVFGCIPDDNVKTILEIQPFQDKHADISRWQELSQKIRGHAVDFPLEFMKDQDLTFKINQKEYFAPDMSFT